MKKIRSRDGVKLQNEQRIKRQVINYRAKAKRACK